MCYPARLFNSNNFATSAALAEVCALLSVVLVISLIQGVVSIISAPAAGRLVGVVLRT